MIAIIFMLFFLFCSYFSTTSVPDEKRMWTQLHHTLFSPRECNIHVTKKELFFCKEKQIIPFTQLIFSWNAVCPINGYFSFYGQVRNMRTKQWSSWHHMIDWGSDIHRSYTSKSDGFSSYVHVRLEIEKSMKADAFRIKVEAHNDAPLSAVKGMFVALSDFNLFQAEDCCGSDIARLTSFCISGIPSIAQLSIQHEDNARICSPVSCSMVCSYLNKRRCNPIAFASHVYDDGLLSYGSWPFNTAHAFNHCKNKYYFCVRRFNSFAQLYQQLRTNNPVIVSVRGTLTGAHKPFPHGHLLVVVGWDHIKREVLCHDPAVQSDDAVFKRYKIEDFLLAWERSHRLAYVRF